MSAEVYRGVVKDMEYTQGSGIGILIMEDGDRVPVEASSFFRAASEVYPQGMRGAEIVYSLTDYGVMSGFLPAEDYEDAEGEV